ncbi:hypothetical protein BKA25_001097 [Actinoalloteichus hymeniacidonis]|nr:hypothetical protein [Actinoalloteichus hymeniacidonis]
MRTLSDQRAPWWRRLLGRGRGDREPELDPTDPRLVVVVTAFDPAEADSSALARSTAWAPELPCVLRHHLLLPAEATAEAARILAQEDWTLHAVADRDPAPTDAPAGPTDAESDEPASDAADPAGSASEAIPDAAEITTSQRPTPGVTPATTGRPRGSGRAEAPDLVSFEAVRVQRLDALHCAQARSRMAGLAQRLGGDALGWDALQIDQGGRLASEDSNDRRRRRVLRR